MQDGKHNGEGEERAAHRLAIRARRVGALGLMGLMSLMAASAHAELPPPRPHPHSALNFTADVIYHVVTDRFVDGDPRNNPKAPLFSSDCKLSNLYCGGDWAGLSKTIEQGYFQALGVTALLISVPYENADILIEMPGASLGTAYHGYWPRDMKRTNPAFGSFADFRKLVDTAHQHGLKLLIDIVTNQGSPVREGDPKHGDGGVLNDNGRPFALYRKDPEGLFHHLGESDYSTLEDMTYRSLYDLADLNQMHPKMDRYLKEMVRLWLDTGIDGLRVDTVKHMPMGWQRSWMETVIRHRPVFTAGEWYKGRDEHNPQSYLFANQSGMNVLDFPLSQRVRQVFRYRERDMRALDQTVATTQRLYRRPFDQVTFIDNHDMNRVSLSDSAEHHRLVDQALAFVLTSRGIPMIYYGTEHYTLGAGHAPINRPMMSSFRQDTDAFALIQRLAALRREHPAIQFGEQLGRWVGTDAYVYERQLPGTSVLVALNRHPTEAVEVAPEPTGLACEGGQPKTYQDLLGQRFGGQPITVDCQGRVMPLRLAPGAIAVWAMPPESARSAQPLLAHAAPALAWPGTELTLSGLNFGEQPDTVWVDELPVRGADLLAWSDRQIRLRLPATAPLRAGRPALRVARGELRSAALHTVDLPGQSLATLRVVVDAPPVGPGEAVWVHTEPSSAACNALPQAWGPMYNKTLYRAPTWYFDVSVPADCRIGLRFARHKLDDEASPLAWSAGPPATVRTPAQGTASVRVAVESWQAATPSSLALHHD